MLQKLIQMEKDNECIKMRAEKISYLLPQGFMQSVVQCGLQIGQLKLAVINGDAIQEANSRAW